MYKQQPTIPFFFFRRNTYGLKSMWCRERSQARITLPSSSLFFSSLFLFFILRSSVKSAMTGMLLTNSPRLHGKSNSCQFFRPLLLRNIHTIQGLSLRARKSETSVDVLCPPPTHHEHLFHVILLLILKETGVFHGAGREYNSRNVHVLYCISMMLFLLLCHFILTIQCV